MFNLRPTESKIRRPWDELDDQYRALFRRIGGFVALSERHNVNLDLRPFLDDLGIVISEFASEAAAKLVIRYRECLAEIALSFYSKPRERSDFLMQAGYTYVERRVLPFWSLAGLYCGYWIVFLALMGAVRIGIERSQIVLSYCRKLLL